MADEDIWDLFFYVGEVDHLVIAEGITRQPKDPLAYANSVLADSELPVLTPEEFRAGVRRLIRARALKREGKALRLTERGKQALELNLNFKENIHLLAPGASAGR